MMDETTFEKHASKWGWSYDNHGDYRGETWTWYASLRYRDIVLLRQPSGRIAAVTFRGSNRAEIWCGMVPDEQELAAVMHAIDAFILERGR